MNLEEYAIYLEALELRFPLVRHRPKGVKEAFLEWVQPQLHQHQKSFWALRKISLAVKKGEVVGMIGRNGSGKSTLLRVIAGIYAPDAGVAMVRGRVSALLELSAGFREELSGLENIYLSGAILGYSRKDMQELASSIVAFSELGEQIEAPYRTYSSGMRSRLGFAVATAVQPEILLIDEALAVGDERFRERSMQRVEELVRQDDTTVIVVSHNTEELCRLCERLVLLERGEIVGQGDPSDVLREYRQLMTKP
ncbi:MAG: ABC transporter ATP-binding protein [Myxococcales bacterium]|nr:ABC transporter ATP-binding protein [Myxococcales bacterium]